ncbi:hypothetical protein ACLB2K_038461 [Fragaria x ananassa]
MKEHASRVQDACSKCYVLPSEEEVLAVTSADDWRTPYLEFLLNKILPADANPKYKVKKTATEFSKKWVEAVPFRKASGAAVCNFIRQYIICGHGVPYKIVTDNGTPCVNREVSDMLKRYGVKHRKSTLYYPQGNGQAEAANKTT